MLIFKSNSFRIAAVVTLLFAGCISAFAQNSATKVDSLERALSLTSNHNEKVEILIHLSKITAADNTETAEGYANRAHTIARNVDDVKGQIAALSQLAAIHKRKKEYESGLEIMQQVMDMQRAVNDEDGLAHSFIQKGLLHQSNGDMAAAREAFQETIDHAAAHDDKRLQGLAFGAIGGMYYEEEQWFEALDYYIQATRVYEEAHNDPEFRHFYLQLGNIYRDQGNAQKGIEYYNSAVPLYQKADDVEGLAGIYLTIGLAYAQIGQNKEAINAFISSVDIAKSKNLVAYQAESYQQLATIYAAQNNFAEAYKYQSLNSATKGNMEIEQLQANVREAETLLSMQEVERERAAMEADEKTQNVILGALIGGLALITLFLIFLLRQMRLKNKANRHLQTAIDKAERSQAEKEKFLAYTSHEVRTPLNAVLGMTELLRKTKLTTDQARYVNTVTSSSNNILVIVNDILDMTKIDSGKIEFESIEFMLDELTDEVIYMLQPKADAKGIKLLATYDPKLPKVVVGDPLRLTQVLLNLVNNAIKFTPQGEVRIGLHVLSENERTAKIGFTVSDTGIGIKPENIQSVFERFQQEDRDTTRKYGGAGLGLSITKQLVELQGGTISVRSKFGEGSTFSVRLTFEKGSVESMIVRRTQPLQPVASHLKNLRILIVDDNSLNRTVLNDLLLDWNEDLRLETANDGEEALRKLQSMAFDVVLMDIQMPKLNGYNATEQIRKNFPEPVCNIPIIAMTAHALSGIADKCKEAGMDDYVSKPIDLHELINKFTQLVSSNNLKQVPANNYQMFDPHHLHTLTNNDVEKTLRYLNIFLKNFEVDMDAMLTAFDREEWDAMAKAAHKMKGNCAYIGVQALVDVLSDIQEYGDHTDVEYEDVRGLLKRAEEISLKAIVEVKTHYKLLQTTPVTE